MSVQQTGSGGVLFKLGLVVLSIGLCALSMLVMRQARLQAAHEVTQTQLRIQRADEQLWKMRADIAALANPSRIRELAGNIGPMHALINPVEASASPSTNIAIPMVEKIEPLHPPVKPETRSAKASSAKPVETKNAPKPTGKPGEKLGLAPANNAQPRSDGKSDTKSEAKPATKADPKAVPKVAPKPDTKVKPRSPDLAPTGLASIPAPKVRELDR